MDYRILAVREHPEYAEKAIVYFSSKWSVPEETYRKSITESLQTDASVPRWYLMMKGEEVVGSFGLIQNDFVARTDLFPYLCALYVEPTERGQALGARMLMYGQSEAQKLGYENLYLVTDHVGYYEKYGWEFAGMADHTDGEGESRIYRIGTED